MADARLPFQGTLAFDRTSQEYIPFKTQTDAMLASLMLAYRLAPPILTVVLGLVRHPNFNASEVTLQKPDDVFQRVADHRAEVASTQTTRSLSSLCRRLVFPHFLLEELVDILANERREKLHTERDGDASCISRFPLHTVDHDLRNVSLVCRSWTRSAQRAIGRILVLQNARKQYLENALAVPLFGPWTREIIIFRNNRESPSNTMRNLCERSDEEWKIMQKLCARLPNVRCMALNTDWFEIPSHRFANDLCRFPNLNEMRLVQVGDITQLLGLTCRKISGCLSLKHLHLQYSGSGSVYSSYIPPSDLEKLSPPPSLTSLSLRIGSTSQLSLQYIQWLTRPREDFRLKSLSLDLSPCYFNELACVNALLPCIRVVEDLHVNASGLGDGTVANILANCTALRRLTIIIRHSFDTAHFKSLPSSIEEVCLDFTFEEALWDRWDDRIVEFLRRRVLSLKKLTVRPVYYPTSGEITPGMAWADDKFLLSKECCKELGIACEFSLAPGDDSRRTLMFGRFPYEV